ncbi:MAG TPA: hypothetical protein VEV37_03130, partial [Bryobacteraceae bacterium]|nr:hypothetical protein [Bryobacteraceae bacterium]
MREFQQENDTASHTKQASGPGEALLDRPAKAESRAGRTIRDIFESGRPLTYIRTSEEQRVGTVLREVAEGPFSREPLPIWTWSLTEGLQRDDVRQPGTEAPRAALDFIATHTGAAIFHLKDFHEPLRESAEIRRRLRDVY